MTISASKLPRSKNLVLLFSLVLGLASSFPSVILAEETAVSTQEARPLPVDSLFEQKETQVETVADSLEYDKNNNKLIAKGNVVITYGDERITSDYAEVETQTKKAYAKGHVLIFSGEKPVAKGEEIFYDFTVHTGDFPQGSLLTYPWHCKGEEIKKTATGEYVARNAVFTTCKGENPPYEIHAKKLTVHQNDKLVAWGVTFYSLGKPIFWWPFMVIPLQKNSLPFSISPGYKSDFGFYVETSKGFSLTENVWGKWHADWRAKKGFGGGADLNYDYGKLASGLIKGYWTQDKEAPSPGLENPFSVREERDRGRLTWWHRTDIDPYSNIQLRYHRVADEYFLQDFFQKESRLESEPQSFVTLTKNAENYGSYIHATKKMNDFEQTIERLPELNFTWKNQPFAVPGVYYENETSYANLAKRFRRSNLNMDVNRIDHVSKWFLPMQLNDFSVTPFLRGEGTYYSRKRFDADETFRTVGAFGVDVRNQYYKTYDVSFEKAGIEVNRLRHVIEPLVRYEGVKSSVSDEKLEQFDNIDAIDDANVFTFGLENRLQTKRIVNGRMKRVDIVSLNTFLNFELNAPNNAHGTSFTSFDQELILRPYDWLQYRVEYRLDFLESELDLFNQDLIARAGRFKFIFGHRFIEDIEASEGSQQAVFDGRFQLNKLWTTGGYLRWNIDDNELEEWELSAERDMGCLVFEFGYNVRNSSIRSSNKQVFFNLRLTDYPIIRLKGGEQRGSFAEPRIGETISGANQATGGDYFSNRTY